MNGVSIRGIRRLAAACLVAALVTPAAVSGQEAHEEAEANAEEVEDLPLLPLGAGEDEGGAVESRGGTPPCGGPGCR